MNAKEFLQELGLISEGYNTLIITQDDGTEIHMGEVMEAYHRAKVEEMKKHFTECLKQPIAHIGNVDYQKGYKACLSELIEHKLLNQ